MRYLMPILLVLAASLSIPPARGDWIEQSDRYAMQVLTARAALQPEYASNYGLQQFDGDVADLGPDISERWRSLNRDLVQKLSTSLARERNARVRQDLEIMIDALRADIETEELEQKYLLPYYNLHELLFLSFRSLLDPRSEQARYPAALLRLRKYTGNERGFEPLTRQAMARTAERLGDAGLIGPYAGQLEADLANTARYVAAMPALFEQAGLEGWEADLATLRQQLEDYRRWLEKSVLPRARPDPQLPQELYANNLKNYGVSLPPQALIERGQYSYQLLRGEMKALAVKIAEQRGWKRHDLISVIQALKQDQIDQDELLPLYEARLRHIEGIIRREGILTLPERPAAIRLATEAESASTPASFMSPPQLIDNTGQYGEFVLVQTNPTLGPDARMDDWSHESITWGLTAHEARPGHELQYAKLVENGTSLARAIFAFNSANAEGWGLYAESIMHPYLPAEGQLFSLFMRAVRAARMFLDPMVNTGQMSRDEAERFLIEQLGLSRPMASSEADRYSFRLPGQATAYYVGYINLLRLRTELEVAQGDAFDQRAFHDYLLEQGLLPPHLLREAVLQHFSL